MDTDLLGEILEHLAADIVELPGSDPQRGIGGQRRFVGGSRSRMGVEPLLGRTVLVDQVARAAFLCASDGS